MAYFDKDPQEFYRIIEGDLMETWGIMPDLRALNTKEQELSELKKELKHEEKAPPKSQRRYRVVIPKNGDNKTSQQEKAVKSLKDEIEALVQKIEKEIKKITPNNFPNLSKADKAQKI